jgi:hypothetical protein
MAHVENVVIAAQDRSEMLLQVNRLAVRATDVADTCTAIGMGAR